MTTMLFPSLLLLLLPFIHATSPTPTPLPSPSPEPPEAPVIDITTPVNRTYLLTNHYWWESPDHQITALVTHLALARNLSATPILPQTPNTATTTTNRSLLSDYFSKAEITQVQPLLTLPEFLATPDYAALRALPTGSLPFPKDSQEEYESSLNLFGSISHTRIRLPLPHVDPEHTNQYCDSFPATAHLLGDTRYIFLDRVHFLHFCAEKYLPWWYDVRHRLAPREEYYRVASDALNGMKKPVAVVHINDVLEGEKDREEEEVERYAREIVDALRKSDALGGSMYLIYHSGTNVDKVVALLKQEFSDVHSCQGLYECFGRVPRAGWNRQLGEEEFRELFRPDVAMRMVEWALGSSADLFVGNVHSPYSRNICLHRKSHGKPYSVLRGFGELKKIWKWNL